MIYGPESSLAGPPTPSAASSKHVSAIVGGVVGCLLVLGVLGFLAFFLRRRYNNRHTRQEMSHANIYSPSANEDPQPVAIIPWTPPPQFYSVDATHNSRVISSGNGVTSSQ
jgi:hypothetical protein